MRNIDIPGAKEIFAKQDELMNTFWVNKGWVKANLVLPLRTSAAQLLIMLNTEQ